MATSAGEVEVKLTLNASDFKRMLSDSTQGVNQFGDAVDSLSRRLLSVFSFVAIADFFKQSLNAYAEQTLATAKLSQALANQGLAVDSSVDHLMAYAESLQRTTGVSVTTVTEAQALMTTFGLQGAVLDRTTKAALNMSAVLGIDLVTSAKLLGKAFDGNYGMLARYGIIIDKSIPPSEQFNAILKQLEDRFGGTATKMAESYGGQIKILGSNFDELEKSIGKLLAGQGGGLIGMLNSTISSLKTAADWLSNINERSHSLGDVLGGVVIAAMQGIVQHMMNILITVTELLSHLPLVGAQFKAVTEQLKLEAMMFKVVGETERANYLASVTTIHPAVMSTIAAKKAATVDYLTTRDQMEKNIAAWESDRNLKDNTEFQASLKEKKGGYEKFAAAFELTTDNMWLAAGKSAKQVTDAFAKGMAEVIVKGKDFHDTMVAIWQDIEMQVIEYILKMITKELILLALETVTGTVGGGGGGVAAAPTVFTGMFAKGGIINEPSVITGMRTGNVSIAGEAGPEAVVPLGQGGGGSGGSITININGQLVEGNAASWRTLVTQQIIPAIRRYSQSNPAGPFNRTRGVV